MKIVLKRNGVYLLTSTIYLIVRGKDRVERKDVITGDWESVLMWVSKMKDKTKDIVTKEKKHVRPYRDR